MSSKEGLVTIFEEMKRRWDVGEKRRGEEKGEGEKEREREGRRIVRGSKVRKMNYIQNLILLALRYVTLR